MKYLLFVGLLFMSFVSCKSDAVDESIIDPINYFPPLTGGTWLTVSPNSLNWNEHNIQSLLGYLEDKNTKGFIILKDGKIVIEEYFNGHTQSENWYWASAGKVLTGLTVGIAQQEGFLNIDDKTSDYLGLNWTSLMPDKENLITIKHQLTMTSGLDDTDFSNTSPDHLTYIADAGTRWAYHNSTYTLLQKVVSNATNQDFKNYFNQKIRDKIGMDGNWHTLGDFKIYWSTTRSMARFGLLVLNNLKWNNTTILNDDFYYNAMINTSQNWNKSYGYLWWLNGKGSFMLPSTQQVFDGSMIPNAPNDMYMALGKNDQKIYIVPSKRLVVIRMGEDTGESAYTLSSFDNVLWEKIGLVVD